MWNVELPAEPLGIPVALPDRIIVALRSGVVSAFHVSDGAELWTSTVSAEGSLAAAADRVVVPSADAVHGLDAATGRIVWSAPLGPLSAPVLLHSGWLIAASRQQVIALRASDGVRMWTRDVGDVEERPAVEGTSLYVPLVDGRLLALDVVSGSTRWEQQLGGAVSEPLAFADRVYVATADKYFHSRNAATGKDEWVQRIGAVVPGRAAADTSHVYVAALDNLLRAFDRINGALRWKHGLAYRPGTGPIVTGESVFVPGRTAELRPFDARTGKPGSPLKLALPIVTVPALVPTPVDGPARLAILTAGPNQGWRLILAANPPPSLTVAPLTVLPGLALEIGG